MRKFFGILVLMIFITGLAVADDVVEKGKMAPNFTLEDLNGNKVTLSDFRGKIVLLNFWAIYCTPCRKEKPSMEKLYRKFRDDGLIVIAVCCGDSRKVVKDFVLDKKTKKRRYTFIILLDEKWQVKKKNYSPSNLRGVPISFVLDKNGTVKDIAYGSRNWMDKRIISYFKNLFKEGS